MDRAAADGGMMVRMAGRSDIGRERGNNEDYLDWDVERGLALLADGVGGGNAGEVASRMAVATLLEQLLVAHDGRGAEGCAVELRRAIEKANTRIYENGRYPPICGMSTTLVVFWLCEGKAVIAHVGDSRIYRLRNGRLAQITVDHSLVQELLDNGTITLQQAEESQQRHLITRALGIATQVKIDLHVAEVRAGDRYLLCSDGLSDMVKEETIAELLMEEGRSLEERVDALIEQANRQGGKDNISALLVAIDESER